jgi:hypothetical protein
MRHESLRIFRDLGNLPDIAVSLSGAARTLVVAGGAATAAHLLSSAETLFTELAAEPPWVTRMNQDTRATIRAQLGEAAFASAWEQGQAMTADEALALAVESLEVTRHAGTD